jgi:hypothetical protein
MRPCGNGATNLDSSMPSHPIVFENVKFFNRSTERYIPFEGSRQITDLHMIPSKGDFVRVDDSESEFIVLDRHFKFQGGTCSVQVDIQPAGDFRPLT